MSHIGSVFLGDVQRHRVLSSASTPPASPNASSGYGFSPIHSPPPRSPPPKPTAPIAIDPAQSLELRIRWLEALLFGVRQDAASRKGKDELKKGESLVRRAEEVQAKLDAAIEGNEGLKRFMEHYDQHAHLLSPSFALSGTIPLSPPTYENMSPSELEVFLSELEPEIRAADRDMRDIEILEKKGVTGAGKLADYQALQPRLDTLIKAHEEDVKLAGGLERRVAKLMERYASHIDALSELFVDWNDTITEAEIRVTKLERERAEQRRLGFA